MSYQNPFFIFLIAPFSSMGPSRYEPVEIIRFKNQIYHLISFCINIITLHIIQLKSLIYTTLTMNLVTIQHWNRLVDFHISFESIIIYNLFNSVIKKRL